MASMKCSFCGKSHKDEKMLRRKPHIWETNPPAKAMEPIWICKPCHEESLQFEADTKARWARFPKVKGTT